MRIKLYLLISVLTMISILQYGCLDSNYLGYVDSDGSGGTDITGSDNSSDVDDSESDKSKDSEPDFLECASQDISIGLLPLDMLLALDTSYSMDFAPEGEIMTKWEAVKGAIKLFVKDTSFDGAGVGLQYFPLRKMCSADAYELPAVEISMLPDASTTLQESLDSQRMAEGTPMVPMLDGVIKYTAKWAEEHPDRRAVIVMATDGIPDNTCISSDPDVSNTLDNVVKLAKTAAEASPQVNTFVIGVGSELTALNDISKAGNGEDAILIDLQGGDVEGALLEALETIRKRSVCEYSIADIADGSIVDPKKINITLTTDSVDNQNLTYVGVAESCELAPEKGWYYDDQKNPEKILFCEDSCKRVQSRPGNSIHFVLGCPTIGLD